MGNIADFAKQQTTQSKSSEIITSQEFQEHMRNSRAQSYASDYFHKIKSDRRYIKRTLQFNEESQDINLYIHRLNSIGSDVESQNLYMPVYYHVKEDSDFCSDMKILELYYEIYDVKLVQQIDVRRRLRQGFSQGQVWYILYSVLNGCRRFEKFVMASGNLVTSNILLNERGHLKILNCLSQPTDNIVTEQVNLVKNFYSPEELKKIRQGGKGKINPNVSQTYSIAIILLELCTSISGEMFYDIESLRINERILNRAVHILYSRYSKLLSNLISTMLSHPKDRPLPSQIYYSFKPYQRQILSLRPFQFDIRQIKLPQSYVSY